MQRAPPAADALWNVEVYGSRNAIHREQLAGQSRLEVGALRGRGRSSELTLIIDFQTFLTFGTKTKMAADHRSPDLKLPINKN